MSDTVSNSENVEDVEDVLSSIKRLVSTTGSPEDKTAAQKAETAEKSSTKPTALLLTSALRVPSEKDDSPGALDSLRQSISDTIEAEDPDGSTAEPQTEVTTKTAASLHWIAPARDGEYYEDEAADDEAIIGRDDEATSPEEEASEAKGANVLHLTPATSGVRDVTAEDATESEIYEVEADLELDQIDEDANLDEVSFFDADNDTGSLSADADLDPNEVEETAHFSMEQSAAAEEVDWNLDHLGSDETDETSIAESWGKDDASGAQYRDSEAEVWDDVVAAGHAPFSREIEDADVAGVATFVRSGREVTYTEVETHDLGERHDVPDAEMVETTIEGGMIQDETDAPFIEDLLDEEALRELVAEIVREELTGTLGERITRNVRKLVRQEINRALAAQDLD